MLFYSAVRGMVCIYDDILLAYGDIAIITGSYNNTSIDPLSIIILLQHKTQFNTYPNKMYSTT